jgi:hypothetical protein
MRNSRRDGKGAHTLFRDFTGSRDDHYGRGEATGL